MSQAKYIVGIDLGTTNTVVTYTPLNAVPEEKPVVEIFPVVQEFAQSALEEKEILPSFLFERGSEKCPLPWKGEHPFIVGEFARERGAEVPGRLVSSAKSWLCNPRINRREPILPWNAPAGGKKISPMEAAAAVLSHVRSAWNQKNKAKLEDQNVVITIPASFDAVAREMTVEAAKFAGLAEITLLEEPQAAFYSWIQQSEAPWREQVKKGDVVLVVDVGGGTSDFSLIEIGEENGDLVLDRVAVGNHILLGGDNMDLTLAYHVRQKLEAAKKKVDAWQTLALSHACRKAKESMLENPDVKSEPIVIAGRGSSVIGGSLKTTLERKDIETILVDGFFPECRLEDQPVDATESGFREVNLAYAADPGITRHLAQFLHSRKGHKDEHAYPNAILFNGGVFRSTPLRDKLVQVIDSWLTADGKPGIRVLKGADLSRAVSFGAGYFGLAREGKGIRIRGGVSQAYYLGIEMAMPAVPGIKPPMKALCVAQIGMEEGTSAEIPGHSFTLVLGRQAQFKFFKSNSRTEDRVGLLLDELPGDLEETSHLALTLPPKEGSEAGTLVDVSLQAAITEIGTLEIWCHEVKGTEKWKLEFNVRDAIK
jgi:Ethanolamine utilization protein EutJ (predicted chaperonin)